LELIGIHPARYWIIAKGQSKRGDGMPNFGVPGNAHYVLSLVHLYRCLHLFSLSTGYTHELRYVDITSSDRGHGAPLTTNFQKGRLI
jgi:hypothetical protein